jgi:hypothetical protein
LGQKRICDRGKICGKEGGRGGEGRGQHLMDDGGHNPDEPPTPQAAAAAERRQGRID